MPDFATFSGLNLERQLTPEELVRALRFLVSAEYEAVQLYQQIHDATPDEKVKKGIKSVIDEERVHAGEFLKMISYMDPEEVKFYTEGFKESEDYLRTASIKKVALAKKIAQNFLESCVTCSSCKESFDWAGTPEIAMGSVNCPQCGLAVDQEGNAHAS